VHLHLVLVLRFGVWIFAALVILAAAVFLVIEAMDKVDSLRKRAPWIPRILERRSAFVSLLLICFVLLIGDGYELLTKEFPEAASLMFNFSYPNPARDAELASMKKQLANCKSSHHAAETTLCLHPVKARSQDVSAKNDPFVRASYGSRITISAGRGMPLGTQFQIYFSTNYVNLSRAVDSDGQEVVSGMSSGANIANLTLDKPIAAGKSLILTVYSSASPIRITCIDKLD
jgi:hypothetical protein